MTAKFTEADVYEQVAVRIDDGRWVLGRLISPLYGDPVRVSMRGYAGAVFFHDKPASAVERWKEPNPPDGSWERPLSLLPDQRIDAHRQHASALARDEDSAPVRAGWTCSASGTYRHEATGRCIWWHPNAKDGHQWMVEGTGDRVGEAEWMVGTMEEAMRRVENGR